MPRAVVIQSSPNASVGYQAFGAAAEFWRCKDPEVILSGPYETGKTLAVLQKLHALLCKYPNARALMVRKTHKSLISSAVVTYEKKVLPYAPGHPKCLIERYGGERPSHYQYPNGSRLYIGGLDNADKFLSAEYDFIYCNQAEEITLSSWELLTGRATGRAGNAPYTQIMGDCNPSTPYHWIKHRKRLTLLESRHIDNPTLYDRDEGCWTPQGVRTLATLDALTGVRKQRGRYGLWVAAEGLVYEEFDPAIHVVRRFPIPSDWRRIRSIDFGYSNPFVCQWWAIDHDGRMYLYREIYMSGRTVRVHSEQIKSVEDVGESIAYTVADHDAEDRATLQENGIATKAAIKAISRGIEKTKERLKVQGDGKPRLFILENSLVELDKDRRARYQTTGIEEEFASYAYPQAQDGKPNKEAPVDIDNHSMDAMRYAVMALSVGQMGVTWA